ncbi:hypothetical protein BMF94_2750 [Rhodotorula taiwanensis]|uniref:NAD(P)-binding protein n=1 Tax=Rhodotorula taiwanensis TaxID=741276 RepID=A0A2S5BBL7_9BASI|nr:hypothetical protein BMF94_2750 [Rhodotorula taiwanensis]
MSKYGPGKSLPVGEFIWGHLTHEVPKPEGNLTGRTALVTGATSGLGWATAQHLARLNVSTLVFPVRSIKKGEQYVEKLHREVPTFRGQVKLLEIDLSRLETIPAFVARLEHEVDRLDIAILNAGSTKTKYTQTSNGFEETIQVNALATGLLAVLLLSLLDKTASMPQPAGAVPAQLKPQLELVASEVHFWVKPSSLPQSDNFIDEVCSEEYFNRIPFMEIYNISKLLDVFLARKIAALPAAKNVQVTTANPGLCKSAFRDDMGPVGAWLFNLIAWTAEFGSRTFVHAVLKEHPSGSYLSAGQVSPVATLACSPEGIAAEDRFFADFARLCEKYAPKSEAILADGTRQ